MIQRYQMQFTIAQMLRWLGVSSSGYYDFVGRQSMPNKYADMDAQIQQLFAGERRRAGAPRITQRLHRSGFGMNQKTVAKRMRVMGLRAKAAKKFKVPPFTTVDPSCLPCRSSRDF
jgi:putative transposase